MSNRIMLGLAFMAISGFSCVSGNIVGTWDGAPDADGRFKRYHFSELKEFAIEMCKEKKSEKAGMENDPQRCAEIMKGDYEVTKLCDTTINCILSPRHKLNLNSKGGGLVGMFARLSIEREMEFVIKGRRLNLGGEEFTKSK